MRANYRVVLATLGVFVSIAGILAAIHGLVFDQDPFVRYGTAAIVIGVATWVMMLNPPTNIEDDSNMDRRK